MWILKWSFKWEDWRKALTQNEHGKGFSPVWILVCLFNSELFRNDFPQMEQTFLSFVIVENSLSLVFSAGSPSCRWRNKSDFCSHAKISSGEVNLSVFDLNASSICSYQSLAISSLLEILPTGMNRVMIS